MAEREIEPAVRRVLDESGRPWSLEWGRRHRKLVVDGRVVAVVPRCVREGHPRSSLNLLATVRRFLRGGRS